MSNSVPRPVGVTVVAVLTWISGLLDIVGGSLLLVQAGIDAAVAKLGGALPLIGSGLFTVILGVVVIIVAVGLLRGNNTARVTITVLEGLSIVGSVFLAIAYPPGAIGEYVSVAVAVVVIALLWMGRANAFFGNR